MGCGRLQSIIFMDPTFCASHVLYLCYMTHLHCGAFVVPKFAAIKLNKCKAYVIILQLCRRNIGERIDH